MAEPTEVARDGAPSAETEGPCAGHLCDRCAICRSGRCSRRDRPDCRLRELGDWGGPIYGELGALAVDGERVECHCCGRRYRSLAHHVWSTHGISADEYRAIFGFLSIASSIGSGTALMSGRAVVEVG